MGLLALIAMAALYMLCGGDGGTGYAWDWAGLQKYFAWRDEDGSLHSGLLLRGLGVTLRLGFWSFLLAWGLGLCFGFMRCGSRLFSRLLAGTYVGAVRNIPPLIVVFVVYFFVGMLFEPYIDWAKLRSALAAAPFAWVLFPLGDNLSFFFSAVLALGVYEGAYAAEIVRAGLESVPKGQWEAAASLGLPRRVTLLRVILPQAFRLMLPPLISQSISLIKDSSIVSAISVAELTFQGREIMNTTYMVFELWITITLMYLGISLVIAGLGHYLEKRSRWRLV